MTRSDPPSAALVAVDPCCCPACGGQVTHLVHHQLALLRGGGYGAAQRVVTRHCAASSCGWTLVVEVSDSRPGQDVR